MIRRTGFHPTWNAAFRCAAITVALAALGTGCASQSTKESTLAETYGKLISEDREMSEEAQKLYDAAEEHWAKRDDKEALKKAIELYGQAYAASPSAPKLLVRCSRAYYLLADGHLAYELQDGDEAAKAQMLATYEKGTEYAYKAMLVLSKRFRERMENGVLMENALDALGNDSQEAMYWYAVNLGKQARAQGFTEVLNYKKRIEGVMKKVLKINPKFFYGAPHRYWGAFYAVAPKFAGGDIEKSKKHFKKALKIESNYFATHVLMAEMLAVKLQKAGEGGREMYEEHLKYVLEKPADVIPEITPENRLEQRKAQKLLDQIDDKFI